MRKVLGVLDIGPFEFFYTMHLLNREEEKLDLGRDAAEQPLPLPIISGGGLLSGETDEVFQRVLRDVLALYQHVVREKLLNVERERKGD